MLWWHKELWLIDHGASLYFHHAWQFWDSPEKPFPNIKNHVLLPKASKLNEVNDDFKKRITPARIREILEAIPNEWLLYDAPFENEEQHREAYATYFINRLNDSDFFVNEAIHARTSLI
jgi:hypothetical protein